MNEIGARLKALRKGRKATQKQLAEALYTTVSQISHWEKGVSLPNADNVARLAKHYGVSSDHILCMDDETALTGINKLAEDIHINALEHGWWEEDRGFPEIVALCHSELSEALEEYRKGMPMEYRPCHGSPGPCTERECPEDCEGPRGIACFIKPEGIAVEMIDCMIRILDWCAKERVDVEAVLKAKHEYNKTRPYKHGGKRC